MLGAGACPLAAQSDPPDNSSTTPVLVTGATLSISGTTIGNTVNTAPFITLGTIVVPDSILAMPLSVSQPTSQPITVTNNGMLFISGSNTIGSPSLSMNTGGLYRVDYGTLLTGPMLSSGTATTMISGSTSNTVLTQPADQTPIIITSGTVSLPNRVTLISGQDITGFLGGITLNTGNAQPVTTTTTVLNATNLTLGNTLLSSNSGTLTLTGASTSNLTISQGTVSFQSATNVTGNLDLQSTGSLRVQLAGTGSTASGVLTVGGNVTLNGDLTVVPSSSVPAGATIVILNKTSAGSVNGTFIGRPQGSVFSANGRDFVINYTGGDGNDVTLTALSELQAWRHAHFGTTSNIGAAADNADADGDGIPNLIERACSLDPNVGSTLPVTTAVSGTNLEYSYVRSVASVQAGDIFTVEWNDSLASTGWSSAGVMQQVLADDGTVQSVKAFVPAGDSGQRFIRLRVTPAP